MRTRASKPDRLDAFSKVSQLLYRGASLLPFAPSIGRYNITVCRERKFIWFRVAKAGTRTILGHLRRSGVRLDAEHASYVHYPVNLYAAYFKFAFVRNPWDRLVSCWHNKVVDSDYFNFGEPQRREMQHFPNFVDFVSGLNIEACDRHLRLQCRLIDLSNLDFLGRLEAFDADFAEICRALGLSAANVAQENASAGRRPYQQSYDDRLRDKVFHIYEKDIRIFRYAF
ncbi:MAG: sulfotransferase family protein [Planctomycetes bacterium]|nr:sulfotransferase family protein [Planctomycetota bacterium]